MTTQATLRGNWNQIRSKLREKWNQLNDEDLGSGEDNVDQLVARIHQKTGESRQNVERYIDELSQSGNSILGAAQEKVQHATEKIRDAAGHVQEVASGTYAAAEDVVLQRPGQSVFVVFACGVVAGLGISALWRDRRSDSMWSSGKGLKDQLERHFMDAMSSLPESVAGRFRR